MSLYCDKGAESRDVPCTQPERSRKASWKNLHLNWVLEARWGKAAIGSIPVIQLKSYIGAAVEAFCRCDRSP